MMSASAHLDAALPVADGATRRSVLDVVGIGLSGLCMVHCLAMPAIIALLPQITAWTGADQAFHVGLAIVLPLIAGLALVSGYIKHRAPMTLVLGGLGLAFIWMALLVPGCTSCAAHDGAAHTHAPMIAGLPLHNVITSVGSTLLITAHAINWRACRSAACRSACHEH